MTIELALEENDITFANDIENSYNNFIKNYEGICIISMFSGEYDKNNAILSLHAGAGGTDACDWVSMLYRMYDRFANTKGYNIQVLDYLEGDEAGIKSITIEISGNMAYGYLKSERGVHRLIRLSPFDTTGKRHTSFASCDVVPVIEGNVEVNIKPEDLRIDTYRSSGAGGQHVNKTDSAIRITHIPTNIIVQCQNERSQHKNREAALKMLSAKLLKLKLKEKEERLLNMRGEVKEIGWSSQIRSYTFHPYNMVKDHRTNVEIGNINAVMDGAIDDFISAYLLLGYE